MASIATVRHPYAHPLPSKRVFEKDSQGRVSVILGVSDPSWRADADADAETEAAAAASV